MTSFHSILCPVDFSEQSRHALRLAGTLAARYTSRLSVLSVVDPFLAEAARVRLKIDLATEETQPALAEFVNETLQGVPTAGEPQLIVLVGNPADAIVARAANDGVELIVMGTQGLGGWRKWLLGSTTEHVLRQTRTPVLTVPAAEADHAPAKHKPFGGGPVLAATDFSEPAAFALNVAAQISADLQVPLVLAHVVEPVIVPSRWTAYVEESNENRVRDAATRLKDIGRRLPAGAQVSDSVTIGNPEEAIAQIADEHKAGVIVIGLAGPEAPFGRRPGSIAYSVLCSARVPVMVVPLPPTPA